MRLVTPPEGVGPHLVNGQIANDYALGGVVTDRQVVWRVEGRRAEEVPQVLIVDLEVGHGDVARLALSAQSLDPGIELVGCMPNHPWAVLGPQHGVSLASTCCSICKYCGGTRDSDHEQKCKLVRLGLVIRWSHIIWPTFHLFLVLPTVPFKKRRLAR